MNAAEAIQKASWELANAARNDGALERAASTLTTLVLLKLVEEYLDEAPPWLGRVALLNGLATAHIRWPSWSSLEPEGLRDALIRQVLPFFRSRERDFPFLAQLLQEDARLVGDDAALKRAVDILSATTLRNDGGAPATFVREVTRGGLGDEHVTPPALALSMAMLAHATPGSVVLDVACGTGSLLACAHATCQDIELWGVEVRRSVARVAAVHLLLLGSKQPNVVWGDSLAPEVQKRLPMADIVVSAPPMGARYRGKPTKIGRMPTHDLGILLMLEGLSWLSPIGRAVFATVEGTLFRGGKGAREFRQALVDHWHLRAVVVLPHGAFQHSSLRPVLLVVDGTEASPELERVRYIVADEDTDAALSVEELVHAIHPASDIEPSVAMWDVPLMEIRADDYDLSLERHRPAPDLPGSGEDPSTLLAELVEQEESFLAGLRALQRDLGEP